MIWPANNLRLSQLEVYASGFSGETKSVEVQDPKTGRQTKATVRKTLQIRYQPPGEIRDQGSTPFDVIERRGSCGKRVSPPDFRPSSSMVWTLTGIRSTLPSHFPRIPSGPTALFSRFRHGT